MKIKLLFVFAVIFLFAALSFKKTDSGNPYESKGIYKGLTQFKIKLETLKTDVEKFNADKISSKELQNSLRNCRNSYKEIEFYIAYHYPEFAKTNLNSAPLYRVKAAGTSSYTLPPQGLQVLDELIFSDEIEENKSQITEMTDFLYNQYANFYLSSLKNGLSVGTNKTIPLRLQLIRIYALGITGFDTPGSLNISEEAKHSLIGIKNYLNDDTYFKNYDLVFANKIIDETINYLNKNADFESFDRIEFYKRFIQPLYAELGKWDGRNDDLKEFSGWNVGNRNFFESDFLDPYFYTLLKKQQDSEELRKLGREIFYDETLSENGKMSCATCHLPQNAFTDLKTKSESNVEGKTVLRNSPSLYNAVFAKRFFYDMRAFYLEQQAEHVIYNEEEFNTTYESIINKLNKNESYKTTFKKLFRGEKINKQNFSKALSSFVASLHSFDSKFDQFMRNEIQISEDAKKGFNLFMGKANCATCHFVPHFSGLVPPFYNENESEILGITEKPINQKPLKLDSDKGRFNSPVEREQSWIFEKSFKTMTVRNIALTKPYFHNGAFNTLEEVMDFYNKGGGEGLGLKVTNQTLPPDQLHLTSKEISQLIEFLNSLTDISKAK